MAKVRALALSNASLSLGLAGIPVEEASDVQAVETRLVELLDSDIDVVVVDEAFRHAFSDWFQNRMARHRGRPLVIFVPSFDEEEANTDAYINAILRPAVGFEIRLD